MTPLKPSEKRLLIVFGTAAFILLNLLGFSWYKKRNLVVQTQRIKLEARANELEVIKTLAPEAEKKRDFLDRNLQAYASEAVRETYLDNFVQTEAANLNLEVRKNQPMPPLLEDLFHKSRYTAEVTGDWDSVLEFIYRLQSPREFRFVPTIRLKSQKKEGSTDEAADVVCTFVIEKWWSPESAPSGEFLPDEEFPTNTSAPALPAEQSPPQTVKRS